MPRAQRHRRLKCNVVAGGGGAQFARPALGFLLPLVWKEQAFFLQVGMAERPRMAAIARRKAGRHGERRCSEGSSERGGSGAHRAVFRRGACAHELRLRARCSVR